MKNICIGVRKNPNTKIKVLVGKLDDVCLKCPYKRSDRCVQSQEIGKWVVTQDRKIAKYLKLKINSIHPAREVFNLSMNKINENTIKSVCKDCIFLDNCIKVGINNSFGKDIKR
jgi:hypothetical protein